MTDTLLTPWLLASSLTILSAPPSQARHQTLLYPINHSPHLLQLTSLIKDPGGAYVGWCSDKGHIIMTVFTNDSVRKSGRTQVNQKQDSNGNTNRNDQHGGNFGLLTKKGIVFRINRWRFARAPVNGIESLMLVVDEWSEVGVPSGLEVIGTPSYLNEVSAIKDILKKQKKDDASEDIGTQQPMTQTATQHIPESPNKTLSNQLKHQIGMHDWKIPVEQEELLSKIQLPCTPEHVQLVVDYMDKERGKKSLLQVGGLVTISTPEIVKDKTNDHAMGQHPNVLNMASATQGKAPVQGQASPSKLPLKNVAPDTAKLIADTTTKSSTKENNVPAVGITPNKQQAVPTAGTRSTPVQIPPKYKEVILIEERESKPVAINPVVSVEKTPTPQGIRPREIRKVGTPSKTISEAFPEHALSSLEVMIQAEAKRRKLELTKEKAREELGERSQPKVGEKSEQSKEAENIPQTQARHPTTSPLKQVAHTAASRSSPSKLPIHFEEESEPEIETTAKPNEVLVNKEKPSVQEQIHQSQEIVDSERKMQGMNEVPILQREQPVHKSSGRKSLLTPVAYRIPNYDMW